MTGIIRKVEGVLIVLTLLLVIATYQASEYALDMEQQAQQAECEYLRTWKAHSTGSISVYGDQCMQDAFKILKPFLMIPMEPQEPIVPKKGPRIA